ncbi:MAG: NCS2 family permease, partial [Kiritimatiellae bacterium]|nr:NCS2 family permease [Kiritimatiellia bacterium]
MKRVLSWFGFNPKTMRLRTEVLAGGTTFLTMAYILAVNPQILGATGMDRGAQFTITAIASGCATLVMGWLSHLPLAMAPGMGVNAFFAYTVCNAMGYSWKFALLAVFLEGVLFLILTVTSLRERIIEAIPLSLKRAIGCGIGFFILFIGLRNGEVLVNSEATLVQLGDVTVGNALLTVIGVAITSMLFVLRVPGVFLIGIFVTTLMGIPLGLTHLSAVTALPPNPSELICAFSFKD